MTTDQPGLATPVVFKPTDIVTVTNGTTRFEITQVEDDMAKIWPVAEDDDRDGQWAGTKLLRLVDPNAGPRLLCTNWDLLTILEGREMHMRLDDGTDIRVRLATPDELLAANASVLAAMPEDERPPAMPRDKAEDLTQPLNVTVRESW